MKNLLSRLLHRYENKAEFEALKARFLLIICIASLFIIPCSIAYTAYLNLHSPDMGYSLNYKVIISLIVLFIIIVAVLAVLVSGHFSIAAHALFIAVQVLHWIIIFNDISPVLSRIDTIFGLIAVLSMAPIVFTRRPAGIFIYGGVNITVIVLFMLNLNRQNLVSWGQAQDVIADGTMSVIIVTIVTYNVFFITRRALLSMNRNRLRMERANEELHATNEELESTMEELIATNEEYEAQNEELVVSQHSLQASEMELRAIFNATHDAMMIHDLEGNILEVNDRFLEWFGITRDVAVSINIGDVGPDDFNVEEAGEYWRRAVNGEDVLFEWRARKRDGSRIVAEVGLKTFERRGKVVIIAGIRDITDRIAAQENLKRREEQYRLLFETANDAIFTMHDEVCIACNNRTLTMYDCTREDIIGKSSWDLSPSKQPDGSDSQQAARERMKAALSGTPQVFQWLHCRKNGTPFYAEVSLNRIEIADGVFLQAIVRDIDERVKAEQEMMASLNEKTLLIREIHHRVKNNMQVISSLLNIQLMNTGSNELEVHLRDAIARIHSMAKIHEKIYSAENFSRIDMGAYIMELYRDIVNLFLKDPESIEVIGRLDPVPLGVDQAVPCGLLINEVLTNSIKHGCAEGRRSVIELGISIHEGYVTLIIADDGPGMTATTMPGKKPGTAGMQIINALARQLSAEISVTADNGTRYEVRFPYRSGN